jgi:hypothetical protein
MERGMAAVTGAGCRERCCQLNRQLICQSINQPMDVRPHTRIQARRHHEDHQMPRPERTSMDDRLNSRRSFTSSSGAQSRHHRSVSIGPKAIGALAVGALALGALAIGALAIGRLAIGRSRIRRLEIDELVVRRLRVTEELQTPTKPEAES